jgi:hypothetical protein
MFYLVGRNFECFSDSIGRFWDSIVRFWDSIVRFWDSIGRFWDSIGRFKDSIVRFIVPNVCSHWRMIRYVLQPNRAFSISLE